MFPGMETWDIATLDVPPHRPEVLRSDPEARVIAINLPAGEALQDHQVHERAWLVVADGGIKGREGGGGEAGGPGFGGPFKGNHAHGVPPPTDPRRRLPRA